MKLLVCFAIVIANITNNGKASLDSFVPSSNSIMFEDTTVNSDKSCYRPCKLNVKPRRCHYRFKIEPVLEESGKATLTVNGLSPGPPINVCVNDVIVVEVQNKIPDQDISLHWHGIEQRGTPYMDGVPMVTQCPISYGSTYKYAFVASTPGTYFYHSDSVAHQSDGVYGALVVNQPQPLEPHSSLYDYDRSKEYTFTIGARFQELLTGSLEDISQKRPTNLLVNGKTKSSKLFVLPGYGYRLRFINGIAVDCAITVRVEDHDMTVIAADGRPVKPVTAKSIKLFSGERLDVVVRATQASSGYWVEVRAAGGVCAGLAAEAMFLYSGYNYTNMLQGARSADIHESQPDEAVYGQMLESLHQTNYGTDVKKVYLGIDRNIVKFNDSDVDFRYLSETLRQPFLAASLSLQDKGVVQINNKSFLYPSAPVFHKPRELDEEFCLVGDEEKSPEVQCVHILGAKEKEIWELALVNEGHGSNDSYIFHMHGFRMHVVATWQKPDGKPLSRQEFEQLENGRKITRNLKNPVIKDTVVVPNKGFTIVRIHPDRGGSWILECRACGIYSLPTAILIDVPQSIPKTVLDLLPKCGTYKPPDVLLN